MALIRNIGNRSGIIEAALLDIKGQLAGGESVSQSYYLPFKKEFGQYLNIPGLSTEVIDPGQAISLFFFVPMEEFGKYIPNIIKASCELNVKVRNFSGHISNERFPMICSNVGELPSSREIKASIRVHQPSDKTKLSQ